MWQIFLWELIKPSYGEGNIVVPTLWSINHTVANGFRSRVMSIPIIDYCDSPIIDDPFVEHLWYIWTYRISLEIGSIWLKIDRSKRLDYFRLFGKLYSLYDWINSIDYFSFLEKKITNNREGNPLTHQCLNQLQISFPSPFKC